MGFRSRRSAKGSTGLDLEFAVIDVETTGLKPATDRVLEIAIVCVTAGGETVDEWTTLVNPAHDGGVGAQGIHGIAADWLHVSPQFSELVGDISQRLTSRVLVGHNAEFDTGFLEAELRRSGYQVSTGLKSVDTMDIAEQLDMPRKLADLASSLGIHYAAHTALDDARVTAQVLCKLLEVVDPETFTATDPRVPSGLLPAAQPSGRVMYRAQAAELTTPRPIMAGILDQLPPQMPGSHAEDSAAVAYLDSVERVLQNCVITPDEANWLLVMAQHLGLSREDVEKVHRDFISARLDIALDDRSLSKREREQIEQFAIWLAIEPGDLDIEIRNSRARLRADTIAARQELAGADVAFTGRGIYSNSIREGLCAKYGIGFRTSVRPDTTLLVLGSADTQNATVEKAAELGIPTELEADYWRRLGERTP